MERWDIYDRNRIKTGKTMLRGSEFSQGDYHMVVHVCIFNRKGEMLIQQRQPFKEGWPDKWDFSVGGSSIAGESSYQAAEREVFEEIGYRIDLSKTRPSLTVNFNLGFDDMYVVQEEIDSEKLTLQKEEVKQVKWASKEEIIRMIEQGDFIPYYKSLVTLLFDMGTALGAHEREE
ncbi:putative Nudix hydrolase YfcD [Lachnospiraceae bacterium KM106-2]|nr:putative Nudix hydrolase YfcD [Lachnospiraceae bacterium KM106-2]